jgi:hypothetical protein
MSLQLVVIADRLSDIEAALGAVFSESGAFPVGPTKFGLSVPTQVLDAVGQDVLLLKLSGLNYFDLWTGRWHVPELS